MPRPGRFLGWFSFSVFALTLAFGAPASAKRKNHKPAKKAVAEASEQTQRAIGELAGKFKWGMTVDQAMKLVTDDIRARYTERIQAAPNAFEQDALQKQMADDIARLKASYVKFDGQKTGWEVSIVDHEFGLNNDESMFFVGEKDQRRFLFFYQGKLWKQFIAFDAQNPAFAGKSFDDFADIVQRRYGPAAMTFRKLRTSDDQTLDHLEWPPSGDFVLWAIDLTDFYGNYCLSLFQKSKLAEVEAGRKAHGPQTAKDTRLIDAALKPDSTPGDVNADIIDQITGKAAKDAAQAEKAKENSDPLDESGL